MIQTRREKSDSILNTKNDSFKSHHLTIEFDPLKLDTTNLEDFTIRKNGLVILLTALNMELNYLLLNLILLNPVLIVDLIITLKCRHVF